MSKKEAFTVNKALGEILLIIRTKDDTDESLWMARIQEVLEKLDSHSWAAGYDDAVQDNEENS